jgi:hypothetical protein
MALKDFPELEAVFNKLTADKEAILKRSAPFRAERDKVMEQMGPLQAKRRELDRKIIEIERPALAEIDTKLAAIARATGGRVLSEGK